MTEPVAAPPLVVLLHGLARGPGSLAGLASYLTAAGFDVAARAYPSRRHSIAYLAEAVGAWIAERAQGRPVAAVTHSLGGVIIRHVREPRIAWHRVVMLAPPNRGSRLAASLAHRSLFRWFYGPAGVELADGASWPAPVAPFAVIAGTRGFALTNPTSWTLARTFPRGLAHDGTVAVEETRLPGMAAYAEVDATHTWIMNDPRARALVIEYLRSGRFER